MHEKLGAQAGLNRDRALLCVVDLQEKLVPLMKSQAPWLSRIRVLVAGARQLGIPILVSEQNPKRLGGTLPELGLTSDDLCIEKMSFSCYREPKFRKILHEQERDQVLICGIETHICVQATGLDLLRAGYEVFVAADATATRLEDTGLLGLSRLSAAGAVLGSVESFLFECLERCDEPRFKQVLPLIKELS